MKVRTRHLPRLPFFAFAILPWLVSAAPVYADVLTINASGTIGTSCTVAATTQFSSPNLNANGTVGGQATVSCNTGFKVNALSANGAMKNNAAAAASFTNVQPYNFTLSVPLETGGPVSATCASSALVAGQASCALSPANGAGLSSGGKASINKLASLTVAWTIPALPTRLMAGSYSDTITLTIAPSP
jgi:hypothetical protein